MLIDCPYCEAKVDAKVIGAHESYNPEEGPPSRISLLECPKCKESLVGGQDRFSNENGDYWTDTNRLWPRPDRSISWFLPSIVRVSLQEANRCSRAGAYTACAVMCGRALEGLCLHHNTKAKNLNHALKELLTKGIIDNRLHQWGDALRQLRNIGAHASKVAISKEDATDVLDFLHAIVDYVFVLNDRFEKFMSRQKNKNSKKG